MSKSVATITNSGHASISEYATSLSKSDLVPPQYKNNPGNCLIAIDIASRMNINPLMVMQNLYPVMGRPVWSSQYVIGAINSCGRFEPLQFKVSGEGDSLSCYAYAKNTKTGEIVKGTTITMKMAKAEGWLEKPGSKWKTMPEQMIQYRAATFFGRLYCPDLLQGMMTEDEVIDITPVQERATAKGAAKLDKFAPAEPQVIDVTPTQAPEPQPQEHELEPVTQTPMNTERVKLLNKADNSGLDWQDWFIKMWLILNKVTDTTTPKSIRDFMKANQETLDLGATGEEWIKNECQKMQEFARDLYKASAKRAKNK